MGGAGNAAGSEHQVLILLLIEQILRLLGRLRRRCSISRCEGTPSVGRLHVPLLLALNLLQSVELLTLQLVEFGDNIGNSALRQIRPRLHGQRDSNEPRDVAARRARWH